MGNRCSVCTHPKQKAINTALISGQKLTELAEQYGLTYAALKWHKKQHITRLMAKAEQEQAALARSLTEEAQQATRACKQILEEARDRNDPALSLRALAQLTRQISLLEKLEASVKAAQTVDLRNVPEWMAVRDAIVRALEPYPEARAAVVQALKELRHDTR